MRCAGSRDRDGAGGGGPAVRPLRRNSRRLSLLRGAPHRSGNATVRAHQPFDLPRQAGVRVRRRSFLGECGRISGIRLGRLSSASHPPGPIRGPHVGAGPAPVDIRCHQLVNQVFSAKRAHAPLHAFGLGFLQPHRRENRLRNLPCAGAACRRPAGVSFAATWGARGVVGYIRGCSRGGRAPSRRFGLAGGRARAATTGLPASLR
jgi:hypothetical protein